MNQEDDSRERQAEHADYSDTCMYREPCCNPSMFVYMIECVNGALYTGYTVDIRQRYQKHCTGQGAKYTRAHKPRRLAACWLILSHGGDAQRVEYLIKTLDRSDKHALCDDPHWLHDLAEELDVQVEVLELSQLLAPQQKDESSSL